MERQRPGSSALVLIYGLSADPVHQGHVELMTQAYAGLRQLRLEIREALFVPVYRRNPVGPQKEGLPETYEHRFAMCRLASEIVADRLRVSRDRVSVSRVEAFLAACRDEPNYTAETLGALRARFEPSVELGFLMSSELVSGDAPEFERWHQVDTILERAALVICPRPGYPPDLDFVQSLRERGGRIFRLEHVRTPEISATELRRRLAEGEDPQALSEEGLLPAPVARYLRDHPIYREAGVSDSGE